MDQKATNNKNKFIKIAQQKNDCCAFFVFNFNTYIFIAINPNIWHINNSI